jgi:3-mercaptopyruvate sulfurtransferase SseA
MRAGFRRVRPLAGGIEAWVARGYDVEMPAPGLRRSTPETSGR